MRPTSTESSPSARTSGSRSPRHFGKLDDATHNAEGINPLCGDKLHLYFAVDADGKIEDSGPGFPRPKIENSFEPYVTSKIDGSGLGLAIAKRIAEDHGGILFLVSREKPTHFCLRLPRYREQMEES